MQHFMIIQKLFHIFRQIFFQNLDFLNCLWPNLAFLFIWDLATLMGKCETGGKVGRFLQSEAQKIYDFLSQHFSTVWCLHLIKTFSNWISMMNFVNKFCQKSTPKNTCFVYYRIKKYKLLPDLRVLSEWG